MPQLVVFVLNFLKFPDLHRRLGKTLNLQPLTFTWRIQMQDTLIATLLDSYFDGEEAFPSLLEQQLKCLTGLEAEFPLDLSATPF